MLHRRTTTTWAHASLLTVALLCCIGTLRAQSRWEKIATPVSEDLIGLEFSTPSTGYAVGNAGTILKSTDAGNTWLERNSGVTANLWAIRFSGPERGFACGDGGTIVATTDGGETWTPRNSGLRDGFLPSFLFGMQILDPMTIVAVGGDGEQAQGVVLKSTDGGTTWSKAHVAGALFLDRCHFIDASNGYVVGASSTGSGGIIAATTDGGITWTTRHTSSGLITAMHLFSGSRAIAVGTGGTIYTTTDGGTTWSEHGSATSNSLLDVVFRDEMSGVAVGEGVIIASSDGGATWSLEETPGANLFSDAHITPDGRVFVAGSGGTILRMTSVAGVREEKRAGGMWLSMAR